MREFQRKTLLILGLILFTFAGGACLSTENQRLCIAILTGCPLCEQGEVAFPATATPRKAVAKTDDAAARAAALAKRREDAARAAALARRRTEDPPKKTTPPPAKGTNDLDRAYSAVKKEMKDAGIKLEDIADGFKARGLLVKKVGEPGATREILIRFDGDVSFRHGSSRLTTRAGRLVDKVGNAMNKYPSTKAKIHGHTDSTGSRRYNTRLSLQRARSVQRRLTRSKGIAKSRILEVKGFADRFRIVQTRRSEPRNRRVEIKIVFENPGGVKPR